MKKFATGLATLVFTLLTAPAPAIDFTPYFADSIEDGVPMRRMYFADGPRRIFYRLPHTWALSGDAQSATLRPKDSKHATVRIQNAPSEHARIPFDVPGREALRKIARSLFPPDATEVTVAREAVNPVVLQGWTSFEAVFDYQRAGEHFCRTVLFINLDENRQVRFIVDAVPAEFPPLCKTTYRTLATWWQQAAE